MIWASAARNENSKRFISSQGAKNAENLPESRRFTSKFRRLWSIAWAAHPSDGAAQTSKTRV
jgi:hypothetical protein